MEYIIQEFDKHFGAYFKYVMVTKNLRKDV